MIPRFSDAVNCPGCGRKIIWIRVYDHDHPGSDSKKIPVDAIAACYEVVDREGRNLIAIRTKSAFVNHFVTCNARDQFKKEKPKKEKIENGG